eukprot:gene123-122_t
MFSSPPPLLVRPFQYGEISLPDLKDLDPHDPKIEDVIKQILAAQVNAMVEEARRDTEAILSAWPEQLDYRIDQPHLVLIRLRVDHTGFPAINQQRFGSLFVKEVANPSTMLLFTRKKREAGHRANELNTANMAEGEDGLGSINIEDLVKEHLENSNKRLSILLELEVGEALVDFVNRKNISAITDMVQESLERTQNQLFRDNNFTSMDKTSLAEAASRAKTAAEIQILKGQKAVPKERAPARPVFSDSDEGLPRGAVEGSDDDEAVAIAAPPKRGRGAEALLGGGSGRGGRATAAEDKGRKRAGAGRGKESAAKSGNAARVPAAVPRSSQRSIFDYSQPTAAQANSRSKILPATQDVMDIEEFDSDGGGTAAKVDRRAKPTAFSLGKAVSSHKGNTPATSSGKSALRSGGTEELPVPSRSKRVAALKSKNYCEAESLSEEEEEEDDQAGERGEQGRSASKYAPRGAGDEESYRPGAGNSDGDDDEDEVPSLNRPPANNRKVPAAPGPGKGTPTTRYPVTRKSIVDDEDEDEVEEIEKRVVLPKSGLVLMSKSKGSSSPSQSQGQGQELGIPASSKRRVLPLSLSFSQQEGGGRGAKKRSLPDSSGGAGGLTSDWG